MGKKNEAEALAGCLLLFFLLALMVFFGAVLNYGNQQDLVGVVQSSYVMRAGKSDQFHVVLRTDDGQEHVLINKDSAWWLKWGSADLYARLKEGRRVRVHTCGYRVPFLSWFPNVIRVEDAR